MITQRRLMVLCLLVIAVPLAVAHAQGGSGEVWVTTQDFCSLRAGPGTSFARLTVVDPGVTLPGIGRSAAAGWVQVDYQGQRGWLYAGFLVWSGDLVSLPVDGVEPERFIRRALVQGVTTRDTALYRREITPVDQVGMLPAGTEVEITGRLGSDEYGFYQLQILYQGQLYWVGSWDIRITAGNTRSLLDTSYLYPYGRLIAGLRRDIAATNADADRIENIWLRLQAGDGVSCGYIPDYAARETSDTDVAHEPIFAPLIAALDNGVAGTNAAISRFADACARTGDDFYLTELDVRAALADIEEARRNLNVATSLLESLRLDNPLLGERIQ